MKKRMKIFALEAVVLAGCTRYADPESAATVGAGRNQVAQEIPK